MPLPTTTLAVFDPLAATAVLSPRISKASPLYGPPIIPCKQPFHATMRSKITPLVKLVDGEEDVYKQLMWDFSEVYVIHYDHSIEDLLSHMIRNEMTGPREERRQELFDILQMMDLSDISE